MVFVGNKGGKHIHNTSLDSRHFTQIDLFNPHNNLQLLSFYRCRD